MFLTQVESDDYTSDVCSVELLFRGDQRGGGRGGRKFPEGSCFLCGKFGHWKNDCRAKRPQEGTEDWVEQA